MNITLLQNTSQSDSHTFLIKDINNTLVSELSNSGTVSICNESIKNSLKMLKKEHSFSSMDTLRASKYMYLLKDKEENDSEVKILEKLRILIQPKIEEDIQKYSFPKTYKTTLNWEVKEKDLQDFISKKNSESSTEEIKKLAFAIYKSLPKED